MKDNLLKAAIGLCLAFAMVRLGEFVFVRVPPNKAGECFYISSITGLSVKVLENHVLDGYSDVEVTLTYMGSTIKDKTTASFVEQRHDFGPKVDCQ